MFDCCGCVCVFACCRCLLLCCALLLVCMSCACCVVFVIINMCVRVLFCLC